MRKIIVLSMITLDGVMQAPGGPEEDTSGGFKYGGWVAPYSDEVYGKLIQLLLKHDLVDELWLKIHPLTLGKGRKLFVNGAIPAAFTLTESSVTSTGVIIANYKRAGEVRTGTIGT